MAQHDEERNEEADLKRREYRDEDGTIHHHTHPYMEEHGSERVRNQASGSGVAERSSRSTRPEEAERSGSSSQRASRARNGGESHHHTQGAAQPITDHDEIRGWAEARGAKPACVRGTGGKGDVGMIRLDFPGFAGGDTLEHISWDEWFKAFDDNRLALIVQDRTAEGERSIFNKLVRRD